MKVAKRVTFLIPASTKKENVKNLRSILKDKKSCMPSQKCVLPEFPPVSLSRTMVEEVIKESTIFILCLFFIPLAMLYCVKV